MLLCKKKKKNVAVGFPYKRDIKGEDIKVALIKYQLYAMYSGFVGAVCQVSNTHPLTHWK